MPSPGIPVQLVRDGARHRNVSKPLQVIVRCSQGWKPPAQGNIKSITLESFISGLHLAAPPHRPHFLVRHHVGCSKSPAQKSRGKGGSIFHIFSGSGERNSFITGCKMLQIPRTLGPPLFSSSDGSVWGDSGSLLLGNADAGSGLALPTGAGGLGRPASGHCPAAGCCSLLEAGRRQSPSFLAPGQLAFVFLFFIFSIICPSREGLYKRTWNNQVQRWWHHWYFLQETETCPLFCRSVTFAGSRQLARTRKL